MVRDEYMELTLVVFNVGYGFPLVLGNVSFVVTTVKDAEPRLKSSDMEPGYSDIISS